MRATITKNISINGDAVYALKSDVTVTKDVDGNNILVLNETELTNIIASLNILAPNGSLSVGLDITALVSALQNGKLDTLLSSNAIRIIVSDLLVSPLYPASGNETVYKLPNSIVEEQVATMSKQEIINIVSIYS
jgi:hypothetical protein